MKFSFNLFIKAIILVLLYYPIFDLVLFYSFVFRAYLSIGYVPSYNNPDPNSLGFDNHQEMVYFSGNLLPISLLVLIALVLVSLFKGKNIGISKKHYIVSFVSLLLSFLTLLSPFFKWFVD
ncbi:MAG: hypothetical protein WCY89_04520 [Flavobacteriaceae bacterium]